MKRFYCFIVVAASLTLMLLAGCGCSQPCGDVPWEDIPWELTAYGNPDKLQSPINDTLVSIQFITQSNQIGGTAGCNTYFGQYIVDKKTCTLTIGESIATTKKACGQPVMEQETKYLNLLKAATRLSVKNEELRITCGNEVLLFKKWVEKK